MKIQPIDAGGAVEFARRSDPTKPAAKSPLKQLWQFPSVLGSSSSEKLARAGDEREKKRDEVGDLDAMVSRFSEEGSHEKLPRRRCICFNANLDYSSDDDFKAAYVFFNLPKSFDFESMKLDFKRVWRDLLGLVPCASAAERNLFADALKILRRQRSQNKHICRRMLVDGLRSSGYDATICKSQRDKDPSFLAREYVYVDVVVAADGVWHLLLMDVDFKSDFEVARPNKSYLSVLQTLLPSCWRRQDQAHPVEAQDESSSSSGGGNIRRSISAFRVSSKFNSSDGEDETKY